MDAHFLYVLAHRVIVILMKLLLVCYQGIRPIGRAATLRDYAYCVCLPCLLFFWWL